MINKSQTPQLNIAGVGNSLSKYTELWARQNAENSTATPINYTHC